MRRKRDRVRVVTGRVVVVAVGSGTFTPKPLPPEFRRMIRSGRKRAR
jgi:acyl-CoA thioesterase FadM